MRKLLIAFTIGLLPTCSFAQSQVQPVVANGTGANGQLTTCPVGNGTGIGCPVPTTPLPTNSSGAYSAATIGTSASTVVAAAGCKTFCDVVNNSNTATICINVGGTATINGSQPFCPAGEITLTPFAHRSWEGSYVPSDAISAIASAASTAAAVGAK